MVGDNSKIQTTTRCRLAVDNFWTNSSSDCNFSAPFVYFVEIGISFCNATRQKRQEAVNFNIHKTNEQNYRRLVAFYSIYSHVKVIHVFLWRFANNLSRLNTHDVVQYYAIRQVVRQATN